MNQTLYERYGGFSTISRLVMAFYDNLLESDQIADYFEDVDMRRLIDHQTKFVASLMGGPASYSNEALKNVHARLNIDNASFSEMANILRKTMVDFNMEKEDIDHVIQAIEDRRHVIVNLEA
ncbi:MAG: group I truncated hemoglobin [Methyloligellaceae bacterium]